MLKKIPLDKINVTKNALFFLSQAPTHNSFAFISQNLYVLKHMVHLSKTGCRIFHFRFSSSFYLTLYLCSTKSMDSLTLKCHNSFQNKNDKATHSFVPRPPVCKLQQKVWKFNDISVSWSSSKTDLETNFLNLENRSFEYVTFSQ